MLTVDHITKRYGDLVALDGVSFSVAPGELFGFVGSNGAGKTTTMRIILGVLSSDGGEVRIDDKPVDFATRQTIGYMPEERGLYPKMKVGDQLAYLAQLHGLNPADAQTAVHRWAERLEIEDKLGKELQALSLGNQQRVQLAAALIHDPKVLVLDEPFSGLDPVAVDVMTDVLRDKANAGVPVIFSSHQLDLVQRLCDRVGIIKAGKIRANGTVDELRSQGKRQLAIGIVGGDASWAPSTPGVQLVGHRAENGRHIILELDPGVDDQAVLHEALQVGPVTHFASHVPSLTEMYREVVSA
ncbi:ATP-binding cassette domain-containing protein [Hoyosella rhizosphaerae]|uniref:ABC transporter ATP-binding protein n=1 Tax=Hoyosella rhizosphaerae TaxID=1755582 RepID=A0A916UIP8_9ACTN|nr:ATP-binding cassette domain-containing protein [Hoyosella rhizosphaerae]GGC75015.1 ABC transporter ATP-binding protein [Hoyosella rhizosphaerae]